MSVRNSRWIWTMTLSCLLGGLQACQAGPFMRTQQDPITPEEHVTLGIVLESEGRTDLAAREFQVAVGRHGHSSAFVGLGNLAFTRGALVEAESYYYQAWVAAQEQKDPKTLVAAGAKNNLAMLQLMRGKDLEAEWLADQALTDSGPLRPYILDTLSRIYLHQHRYPEAWAALVEAEGSALQRDEPLRTQLAKSRRALVNATVH